jgi:hypothetical protein
LSSHLLDRPAARFIRAVRSQVVVAAAGNFVDAAGNAGLGRKRGKQ